MNSDERKALRQALIRAGFELSESSPEANLTDPEAQPGEYDEYWINANADQVEIKWAART